MHMFERGDLDLAYPEMWWNLLLGIGDYLVGIWFCGLKVDAANGNFRMQRERNLRRKKD